MSSVIVDYNSGNLHSAKKSFQRISLDLDQGEVLVSSDTEVILKAERLILPGVGSFNDCKANLLKKTGLFEAIEQRVIRDCVPFLGICVGQQLMATTGLENNSETAGFDWITGTVVPITPLDQSLKIPHMGWNTLHFDYQHSLFNGINEGDHVYFVHSYHLNLNNQNNRVSYTNYGGKITAAVLKDNMVGTQFHPEKSQAVGLTFIRNFLLWRP